MYDGEGMRALTVMLLLSLAAPSLSIAETLSGAQLFAAKGCHICHGLEGRAPLSENYPVLAGQNVPYLIQQLADIKRGSRSNGLSPTMRTIIEFVSDQEIEHIARYLGGLPWGDHPLSHRRLEQ